MAVMLGYFGVVGNTVGVVRKVLVVVHKEPETQQVDRMGRVGRKQVLELRGNSCCTLIGHIQQAGVPAGNWMGHC